MDYMPTYDPQVAFSNFDPLTLLPIFPTQSSTNANVQGVTTPSGAPVNFAIPPPQLASFNLPDQQPQQPTWQNYLPYIIGGATILLLIGIYFIIRKGGK